MPSSTKKSKNNQKLSHSSKNSNKDKKSLIYKPFKKQSGRLEQPGGTGLGAFGISNSLSGDGKWLAVGAPSYPFLFSSFGGETDRVGPGAVTIYRLEKNKGKEEWKLIQNFTAPNENNFSNFPVNNARSGLHSDFGFSLSFNEDGQYLAISGPGDDQSGLLNGAIWIYIRNDKTQSYEIAQKVVPVVPGNFESAIVGVENNGLSINKDGTLIAFGIGGNANFTGGVGVLKRDDKKWYQLLMEGKFYIPAPSDLSPVSEFGFSVKFSSSGQYLVAGAHLYSNNLSDPNNHVGAAYVFKLRPARNELRLPNGKTEFKNSLADLVYKQVGTRLIGSPTTPTQTQGLPVTISGNGEFVASYGADPISESYVYIYKKQNDQYIQTDALPLSSVGQGSDTAPGQFQSRGISFNEDATILAVGVPHSVGTQFKGSIRIYRRSGNKFILKQIITDINSDNDAHQGTSVSLSSSGHVLAFGGGSERNSRGSIFIWTLEE